MLFFKIMWINMLKAQTFTMTLIFRIITGAPFPNNFREVVKTIFKRLFRVYAHIYHSHFQKIVSLKEEAHLNTCFKHFTLFTWVSSCPQSQVFFFFFSFVLVILFHCEHTLHSWKLVWNLFPSDRMNP